MSTLTLVKGHGEYYVIARNPIDGEEKISEVGVPVVHPTISQYGRFYIAGPQGIPPDDTQARYLFKSIMVSLYPPF